MVIDFLLSLLTQWPSGEPTTARRFFDYKFLCPPVTQWPSGEPTTARTVLDVENELQAHERNGQAESQPLRVFVDLKINYSIIFNAMAKRRANHCELS